MCGSAKTLTTQKPWEEPVPIFAEMKNNAIVSVAVVVAVKTLQVGRQTWLPIEILI